MSAKHRFGNAIREARKAQSYSQLWLSKCLGTDNEAYVSRIENGKKSISPKHLKRLSEVLKIDLQYLVFLRVEIERERINTHIDEGGKSA